MVKTSVLAGSCLLFAALPSAALAAYQYPGSAALQPLAVIEPVTEGSFFRTFAPVDPDASWSLGVGYDAYRLREDTADKDIVAAVTAAWSPAPRWLAGITLPYIARDPELNESGLLDARAFVRRLFVEKDTGFKLGGELSVIAPTGGSSSDLYPLSLETTVLGGRVCASTGAGRTALGANVGYQTYLQTEEGSDSDLLYGLFVEHSFSDLIRVVVEYAGSSHSHSGSGEGSVSDDYVTIGASYRFSSGMLLGLGAALGSGDSFADQRLLATFYLPLGGARAPVARPAAPAAKPAPPEAKPAPPAVKPAPPAVKPAPPAVKPARVQVRIRNASGVQGLGQKTASALKEKGYSVAGLSDPDPAAQKRTVILYPAGMVEQAVSLSRVLTMSKVVRDIQLNEAGAGAAPGVLVLLIGSDQKK